MKIGIIKNTQDPSNNGKTFKYVALNTKKKLCKLLLHKDFLTIYKNHERQEKGFNIKFNLSLCANDKHLQRSGKPILNQRSRSYKNSQH